jgi:hypothetical protein
MSAREYIVAAVTQCCFDRVRLALRVLPRYGHGHTISISKHSSAPRQIEQLLGGGGNLMTMLPTRRAFIGASVSLASALTAGLPARVEAVEVGQKAPDFNLPATSGGNVSLSQFRGQPVLIEFYGADFAPV